jgi:SAM-dependent methyltransferase
VVLPFTSHNVRLLDGSETAPGQVMVADSGICRAALHELELAFGKEAHGDVTVADLGCLEAGYAAEFARAGYDVTGVEVRQENYDRAVWLQGALQLPNLRFVLGDAREALDGMSFDAVFCCGLLYHLDRPVAFLNQLAEITRRMLILHTHYSAENGHAEYLHGGVAHCDPPSTGPEGYPGHWFHETADNRWASYGNRSSFWLRKEDLLQALTEAGFTQVAERREWLERASAVPWGSGGVTADRGMFVAFKP